MFLRDFAGTDAETYFSEKAGYTVSYRHGNKAYVKGVEKVHP